MEQRKPDPTVQSTLRRERTAITMSAKWIQFRHEQYMQKLWKEFCIPNHKQSSGAVVRKCTDCGLKKQFAIVYRKKIKTERIHKTLELTISKITILNRSRTSTVYTIIKFVSHYNSSEDN